MPAPDSRRGRVDEESLHSLLAGGKLSGAQRERVLEGALRRSRGGRWRVLGALAVALPAAAAVALFLRAGPGGSAADESRGTFVAKGAAGPFLSARCPGRAAGECRLGDRLIFEVEGAQAPGFFAAYAECPSKERIWYFPAASGEMPRVAAGAGPSIVEQAARIGPEHGAGRCMLQLFLLPAPASRATVSGLGPTGEGARASVAIAIER